MALLISPLAERISLFFFSLFLLCCSFCQRLLWSLLYFQASKSSLFTSGFPISQACRCNLVPTLVPVDLVWTSASPVPPLTLRGQSISHLCRGSAGLFLQKLGHRAPLVREGHRRLSHSTAWVRTPLRTPQQEEVFPRCFSLTVLNNSSSSLGELSAVINSVPFRFKIGLRKMPGCLIFKLNV